MPRAPRGAASAGPNPAAAGAQLVPAAVVQRTRFRSVAAAAGAREPAWRIVARYGITRMTRTWYLSLMLVLLLVFIVATIGQLTYSAAQGAVPTGTGWGGRMTMLLVPAMAFLLVAGAPLLAEDLRFNAPAFYFSRPMRVHDYLRAKVVQLGALLGSATLVPVALSLAILLVIGLPAARTPTTWDGDPLEGAQLAHWRATHVDTFGDWLYIAVAGLPAMLMLTAFLGACALLVSAHTRRGWHAAIGVVALLAGWSILGGTASEFTRSAFRHAFDPVGWIELMVFGPLELRFDADRGAAQGPEHLGAAIVVAYVLAGLATWTAYSLTWRKVRAQEALA